MAADGRSDANSTTGATAPLLGLSGITKAFPGVVANDSINLNLAPGEIHALLGENGAGKSTLVKIIYGLVAPDAGEIRWRGTPVAVRGPAQARALGIGMVFQHFSLFDSMTVLENIALAMTGERDMNALRERVVRISRDYGLPLDPDRHVHSLSVGERQRIEIVRCLLQDPQLLILDEPTSVLTPGEARALFSTLRQLAGEGRTILYISHKLAEVMALCERATVLRGGRVVATCRPAEETPASLAAMMIGAAPQVPQRATASARGPVRLAVDSLDLPAEDRFAVALDGVGLEVHGGEIVGIAGIAGNGQQELMRALIGETRLRGRPDAIRIDGKPVGRLGPRARRALGVAFVPEQRIGHGAVAEMSLAENGLLGAGPAMRLARGGFVNGAALRDFAQRIVSAFDVRARGIDADAASLSGGNLQKFIVGREILQEPGVLVINQPTWGVDAGAAAAIHQALLELAGRGSAVLMISQDLDEIFLLADRIAVIGQGRLSSARPAAEMTVETIGRLMGGEADGAASMGGAVAEA
jgi:ABC-type uncharacterized transport system ATPase subunit